MGYFDHVTIRPTLDAGFANAQSDAIFGGMEQETPAELLAAVERAASEAEKAHGVANDALRKAKTLGLTPEARMLYLNHARRAFKEYDNWRNAAERLAQRWADEEASK